MKRMRRILTWLITTLLITISAHAASYDTFGTLPSAGSGFFTSLTTYITSEAAEYTWRSAGNTVLEGGYHAVPGGGGLNATVTEVKALVDGQYTHNAAYAHTYTATRRTFVCLRSDTDTSPSFGIAGDLSLSNNLVFFACAASTVPPKMPTGVVPLMYVDTDGTDITSVTDQRTIHVPLSYYGDVETMTTTVGSTPSAVIYVDEYFPVAANDTITSNIVLSFLAGGVIAPDSGVTLTLEGPIIASPRQIFKGAGSVSWTIDQMVHDKWEDGSGDDWFPSNDNTIDWGGASNEIKDLYVDGIAYLDRISLDSGRLNFDDDEDTYMYSSGDGVILIVVESSSEWTINSTGIIPVTDSSEDIGDSTHYIDDAYIDDVNAKGLTATSFALSNHLGFFQRPIIHVGTDAITLTSAKYHHAGTTSQIVYWNSLLAFNLGNLAAGGDNDDSSSIAAASTWHYIYLDDSAIVTQGVGLIDADCFLNSTTAPTWSATGHGWYNGSDRCIFAVRTTSGGGALEDMYHKGGDYVQFGSQITTALSAQNITDSFVDYDTYGPDFGDEAFVQLVFTGDYVSANTETMFYGKGGEDGDGIHLFEFISGLNNYQSCQVTAAVDADQEIAVKEDTGAATHTLTAYLVGFYLPGGM